MKDSAYIDVEYRRGDFSFIAKTFIPSGIVGIYGPSGHGKSTLFKLLSGIEKPDSGQIIIQGEEVYNNTCKINVPSRKRNLGLVFQEGLLFPHMSVRKNLLYGHCDSSSIQFDEIVDLLEIQELLDKKPHQCSGGEKQRVAIGRMLLSSPSLLMLDEPFSSLDHRLRIAIIPYLLKIHAMYGLPILVVSHDLQDLLMLTTQLMIVENGRIRGVGNYHDLYFLDSSKHVLQSVDSVNAVRIQVLKLEELKEMSLLYYDLGHPSNCILLDSDHELEVGSQLILYISPQNISLSIDKVEGISTRNQLRGQISSIHIVGNKVFCKVDVGFSLLVEITKQSLVRMGLKVEMKVCCLFKASAVKIIF